MLSLHAKHPPLRRASHPAGPLQWQSGRDGGDYSAGSLQRHLCLKVLGTPIGHPHLVALWAESWTRTEREFLSQLPRFPDLQCAWLLNAMCASPRANHAFRTVPPLDIAGYAQAHDDAVGRPCRPASAEPRLAKWTAHGTLPASLGGLPGRHGLEGRDAERLAAVAQRWHATSFKLKAGRSAHLGEQSHGARPRVPTDRGLGDSPHGSQHGASRTHNLHFRKRTLPPHMPPSACARLRSQAGPHAGDHTVPASHAICAVCASHSSSVYTGADLSRVRRARRRVWPDWLGEERSSNGRG